MKMFFKTRAAVRSFVVKSNQVKLVDLGKNAHKRWAVEIKKRSQS